MKIDFSTVLKDLEGRELKERIGSDTNGADVLLTAGRACAAALQGDKAPSGADAVDRMRLAIKLVDPAQPVEISEKDKDTILKSVEKTFVNLVYFRVFELFGG